MDLVEVFSFLFMLSTMELGRVSLGVLVVIVTNVSGYHFGTQEYSTDPLSETQKAMLEDLRDYGLVWQRKVWQPDILHDPASPDLRRHLSVSTLPV